MRWPTITCLLLLASLQPGTTPAAALHGVQPLGSNRFALLGEFGAQCERCEVIVEYADGLHYAAEIEQWAVERILARVPDLNRAPEVRLRVRSAGGLSAALPTLLIRTIVPNADVDAPGPSSPARPPPLVERTSNLAVGDKGVDVIDLSTPAPGCGRAAALFDHAQIVYADRRFGEAQIVALPPSGCSKCPPLRIRWYHEPTGRLSYQVHIYKRIVEGVCTERIR